MKTKKSRILIGVLVILIAGIIGTALQPVVLPYVRDYFYHQWALDWEEQYPNNDIVEVKERVKIRTLLIYYRPVRITGTSSQEFLVFIDDHLPKLVKTANFFGFGTRYISLALGDPKTEYEIAAGFVILDVNAENGYRRPVYRWSYPIKVRPDYMRYRGIGK